MNALDLDRAGLMLGDCLALMRALPSCSVDSVVTDPPYELGFMGKTWDASGIAYSVDLWAEVLRVLKPGGHLLSFGGTRTYHRMACAIEDAGFEIRDSLHWMYGTGFPKSLNVSKEFEGRAHRNDDNGGPVELSRADIEAAKQWDGWGTALKPGHEPIVLARKPLEGTVAANVLKWGTGGLNIDGCRLEGQGKPNGVKTSTAEVGFEGGFRTVPTGLDGLGRWPANVLLDEAAAAELDAQSGDRPSGSGIKTKAGSNGGGRVALGDFHRKYEKAGIGGDSGGASRFFFVVQGDLCSACASDVESCSTVAPHHAGGSVPGLAKASLNPDTNTRPASTNGTQNGSKQTSASGTQPMLNSGSESKHASLQEKRSPKMCRACGVGIPEQTDITKTTIAPSTSSGSAADATSGNTSQNSEPGDQVSVPFRYVAKPSRKERDLGCADLPAKSGGEATDREDGSAGVNNPGAGAGRTGGARNWHPTVKPIELMRYLCRLVTPPGGIVLDPFTGSGTTGIAALKEGLRFIGMEASEEYFPITAARITHAHNAANEEQ